MSPRTSEIHIREQTKLVLQFLENGDFEKAKEVVLGNKEILRYNFGLINFIPLIPRIRFSKRIPKNNDALKMIIDTGFEIFTKENNTDELIFFAAAKCEKETLKECITQVLKKNSSGINQVREGDTVLMFLIKYGNIAGVNYPDCMKMLIEAGVDVNRNDYFSHSPILFLLNLYCRYTSKTQKDDVVILNLRTCIQALLETKSIDISSLQVEATEMSAKNLLKELHFVGLEYPEVENAEEQQLDKLFKYLINNQEDDFIKSKETLTLLDADDGNNTFLQLCCEKNLKKTVAFLIENGADLCQTTKRNPKTPLELAARRNHSEIFDALLKTNKIMIDEELFLTFLRNRPKHIKAKYFDEILKYKHLDVNMKSNNGNTPLHYAIIFSSAEAIGVLLQRGASLTVTNNSNKCPLDYISAEDLEKHLNKCIVPDSYNDINSGKYEVALNYRNLIDVDELTIIEKIGNSSKLCHLLRHPLISSFIDIKWKLVEPVYRIFFMFRSLFYIISILSFINLNLLNYLAIPLAFIYGLQIWSTFNWKNNKLHETVDIVIALILFLSFFVSSNVNRYQLGLIATIFMAFSFHLFWRFSPNFSHFHALVINILSHLFSYLFYILSLILFFGAAFHIFFLVRYENLDDNYSNSLFNDVKTMPSDIYLLCIFGVFVGVMVIMTMINSVTYLQENPEYINNNFRISGYKNVLMFLKSIEQLHLNIGLFANPLIFENSHLNENGESSKGEEMSNKKKHKKIKDKNKYLINFNFNVNRFSFEKLLSVKLTKNNVLGIRKSVS